MHDRPTVDELLRAVELLLDEPRIERRQRRVVQAERRHHPGAIVLD